MKNNVLIADDDRVYCEVLKEIVQQLDCDTTICNDGREAIKAVDNNNDNFKLVLLDIYMPDIDGISVLGHLINKYPDLPVVMITGSDNEDFEDTAQQLGALAYITKSSHHKIIKSRLFEILGKL